MSSCKLSKPGGRREDLLASAPLMSTLLREGLSAKLRDNETLPTAFVRSESIRVRLWLVFSIWYVRASYKLINSTAFGSRIAALVSWYKFIRLQETQVFLGLLVNCSCIASITVFAANQISRFHSSNKTSGPYLFHVSMCSSNYNIDAYDVGCGQAWQFLSHSWPFLVGGIARHVTEGSHPHSRTFGWIQVCLIVIGLIGNNHWSLQ